jgi:hypothetical protein
MGIRLGVVAGSVLILFLNGPPAGAALPTMATSVVSSGRSTGAHGPSILGEPPIAPGVYEPPLPAPLRVQRGFEPPPDPYAAGHRGVDLAVTTGGPPDPGAPRGPDSVGGTTGTDPTGTTGTGSPGATVFAAASGTVGFSGQVAGRRVLVIIHPDGISTEYEPIHPLVESGSSVRRGQIIGRLDGAHGECAPDRCLHWGARRDGRYLDPLGLLTPLGPVRLLPRTGPP